MSVTEDVLAAANRLIDAYGAGDSPRYLACFTPDASFIFYFSPRVIESLEKWAAELAKLEAEGTKVISCKSTNQCVRLIGTDTAIFYHDVTTVEEDEGGGRKTLFECETIVFHLIAGRWMAVHEHLSERPVPTAA